MNILIIEDDPTFGLLLKRSLQQTHFFAEIQLFNNVEEALNICQTGHIDYAIVDLKLNQASGLSVIEKIKYYHLNAKILMLTGYASIATAVEAMKLGAINYLPKPASVHEILTALEIQADQQTMITQNESKIPDKPISVARLEWEHIQRILNENEGNISATARALNMHRRTLQRKLNEKNPPK